MGFTFYSVCDLQKCTHTRCRRLLGLGGRLLGLQDLDDDLLLLNQEGAHDALPQAAVAQDTSVGPADGLLALGHAWALAGAAGPDALQLLLALAALGHITALLDVLVHQTATGRANAEREYRIRALPLHQIAMNHLHTAFVGVCVVRQTSSQCQSLDHF